MLNKFDSLIKGDVFALRPPIAVFTHKNVAFQQRGHESFSILYIGILITPSLPQVLVVSPKHIDLDITCLFKGT